MPAAYFAADAPTYGWLSGEALRIWVEHGPGPAQLGATSHAADAAVALLDDYAVGYRALCRFLAVGEARGYEPTTSQVRHLFSIHCCWFEPLENAVDQGRRAREGLLAGGDLTTAGYTYHVTAFDLLDCAPSLDGFVAEVEAGLELVRRTGHERVGQWLDCYRWLAGVLRGESPAAAEGVPADRYAGSPLALFFAHFTRALAAAVFDDPVELGRHSGAAMALLSFAGGFYQLAVVRLLRGLALAGQARATEGDERGGVLAELDDLTKWLAARAADAPDNFLHLLRLVEAERAWAVGDFRAAVAGFDAARREVMGRERPWHQALIAERAARFYLAHGLEHAGHDALAQARQGYLAWGATAKVEQLDWAYPILRPHADATGERGDHPGDHADRRSTVTTGTIDLLGILSASQALSSETSVERLHARVVDVLGAMTGATGVQLLLWNDDRQDWLLPMPGGTAPVTGAGPDPQAPMSVLRYAQRTGEPLVVGDATEDERFARDPYFAGLTCCSLLALPILSRGELRALLVLENRLIRSAFTAERLDAVKLIAGQLAVSLDNAESRAELTASRARVVAAADQARRRIERDLHDGAQQGFVNTILMLDLARRALAGVSGQAPVLLAEALEQAKRANQQLRELAHGIHPGIVRAGGLGPALEELTGRCPIPVTLDMHPQARLAEHIEVTAYLVVSEALTNAAKHAHASRVQVTVETADGDVRLSVADDGVGGADPSRGSGLVGLKDRVEAVGGRLSVHSRPGQGTRLLATLPLDLDLETRPG
jgi:signal transduction histidine kinase